MIERRFIPYSGPNAVRLPTDSNHINFKWVEPGVSVCFSATRQGDGMSCHFTADRSGVRRIHDAIDEFCEFVFYFFPWCRMVIAKIIMPKVIRIVRECGFEFLTTHSRGVVYIMRREAYGV